MVHAFSRTHSTRCPCRCDHLTRYTFFVVRYIGSLRWVGGVYRLIHLAWTAFGGVIIALRQTLHLHDAHATCDSTAFTCLFYGIFTYHNLTRHLKAHILIFPSFSSSSLSPLLSYVSSLSHSHFIRLHRASAVHGRRVLLTFLRCVAFVRLCSLSLLAHRLSATPSVIGVVQTITASLNYCCGITAGTRMDDSCV